MSDVLSEHHADQQVIKNLHKEIARLKGLIMSQTEGKLLLDIDGNIYLSTQHQLVSEAGVAEKVEFEEVKKTADRLQGSSDSAPAAPAAPAPTTPTAPEAPSAPVAPTAPVAPQTPAPEAPTSPAAPIIVQ